MTTVNLTDLSLSALVSLHNEIADKPISKFKDKPTAIARLEGLMADRGFGVALVDDVPTIVRQDDPDYTPPSAKEEVNEPEIPAPGPADQVEDVAPEELGADELVILEFVQDNASQSVTMTQLEDILVEAGYEPDRLEDLVGALNDAGLVLRSGDEVRMAQPEAPAPKKERKTRSSGFMGKTLELLVQENPKRKGSRTWQRYELYRTVKTTDEYMEAALALTMADGKPSTRREVMSDLGYDFNEKGYIAIGLEPKSE